ncbi:MAG: N-acetylneuraminate epimerase [Chloroflexi bacterium ADurb.Bin360]|nr:MAG: N-acetylneuraminate epimerase [Chloroflexi bacterium ADurb.Bin360]
MKGNLIANITGTGLEIGSATVVSNTFTGIGGNAVRITSGAPVKIAGNNFEFNTGTYDVENLILATALPTIDARNNWWGTTEGNVIQTRIFDYGDDYTLGTVLHAPVLAAPATDAPAYVRSVTLAPESPVGIQTVTFDVEFSREMDTMVAPSLAFANEEGWVSQNPMPTARRQFEAVTTPDGRIYTVGGYGGSFLATMEEYDPVSNTWRARQSMPTARVDPAVAVTPNGRILVIGGNLDGVRLNTIEEYDPATDTWRTLSPMPTARQDAGAVTAPNGLIYVIGGTTGDWNHLSNVEVYDPIMDTWQTRSPMPTARGSLGVVLGHNGRIYAIGGNNGVDNEGSMGTVEEYDPATDTWRTRATMPTSRRCLATVTSSNGRIYAVGGLSAQVELLDTLEEYDPVANSWQQLEPLSFPRMAFTAAPAVGSTSFYVIGGYVITDNLAAVEKYTPPISDPELYNASWPQPDHYRSSSDITALIPRGVYHLTVSDAVGTDGIEIAPNSITAFTVDYAGAINDTTPPPMPSIIGCAGTTPDALSAEWSVNDPESAITLYQYAIGTTLDGAEVVNWTNTAATEMSRSGLALSNGQRVYISVRARNEGGLWSQAGSIGVLAGSGECDQNRNNYPIYLPLVLRTQP